ncbi:uncharacterized protein At4g04775-like [Eutrema salsugineum]|uniref:uncharacterized protein At4g04775-like n=1 Tax=Eutrema salsugineum TaxID=72664 RepID=UPI000CED7239|nr:uncharacterized protein At4g04775-like [Eutrema salsugineum]XP_024009584.1 uncharacterized protein At4g04775-like [Eutrema salsugineum]XP_024009585.1 uncharacterized protein At4g04775-like [Eutrema salsugineum]XP_024009586.1 uncharacterized protein At4g04775-like [Eutrema salsugineum]
MPSSYTNSSSSVASYDSGCAQADGNFGIPVRCYCGRTTIIEESTAPATFGRKFYTCPEILAEESPDHIWKWWDEAVEEQLTILQLRLDEHSGRMENYNRTALLQSYENRLYTMEPLIDRNKEEIAEIKEVLVEIQGEVARMKETVATREKYAVSGFYVNMQAEILKVAELHRTRQVFWGIHVTRRDKCNP